MAIVRDREAGDGRLPFTFEFIDPKEPGWDIAIENLRYDLGAPTNPELFPPHFLKKTFPKIGGKVCKISGDGRVVGALFLFPRNEGEAFTARVHLVSQGGDKLNRGDVWKTLNLVNNFELYFPGEETPCQGSHTRVGNYDLGRPEPWEYSQIRKLQRTIWGSEEDYLYPSDIHSQSFGLATSLVARHEEEVVGFLFAFYKSSKEKLPFPLALKYRSGFRVESQLMGSLPELRKHGLGFTLKKLQAEKALKEGIDVVNWTVDPLQFANAALNFGKLRALAFDFYPNFYDFRNDLNQVSASRFGITLLVPSDRYREVADGIDEPRAKILQVESLERVVFANKETEILDLTSETDGWVAIEIPEDWNGMQRNNLAEARVWRETTDKIFSSYLRRGYAICEVGKDSRGKCYLLARKLKVIEGL